MCIRDRDGNGIKIAAGAADRIADIKACLTADSSVNNRLTGVIAIYNGATELVTGANYMIRSNAHDEGSVQAGSIPYSVVGDETLTVENRFSQDGTVATANTSLGQGSYFYVSLRGGK